jgi:hypothetical protein
MQISWLVVVVAAAPAYRQCFVSEIYEPWRLLLIKEGATAEHRQTDISGVDQIRKRQRGREEAKICIFAPSVRTRGGFFYLSLSAENLTLCLL